MPELCSIITPAYNAAPFIGEAIGSVLAQTYQDWEMIIVDDCSTDGTRDVAESEGRKDGRLRVLRNRERSGQSASRNAGISAAKGRYVAFLDSDDLWAAEKLSRQIRFMEEKKSALSYTSFKRIDESGRVLDGKVSVPGEVSYESMLSTNYIGCLTAVYDAGKLGKQFFTAPVNAHEDYALWLKILKMTGEAHGLDETLAFYRIRKGSVSRNKLRAACYQWKIYREVEGLPLLSSVRYFVSYASHGCRKSCGLLPVQAIRENGSFSLP